MTSPLTGYLSCPNHLSDLLKPLCVDYRKNNILKLASNYRSDIKTLCHWMASAIEAIGIKLSAISVVMSDPSLNGSDANSKLLLKINELRQHNHALLENVEKAYGVYSDINNMKNKKEYDMEVALSEIQPNKYSNEDQLNMTSSI